MVYDEHMKPMPKTPSVVVHENKDPEMMTKGELLEDNRKLRNALRHTRGWIVTCSDSRTAQKDLKMVDALLQ